MTKEEEKLIEEFWEDYKNSSEPVAHFNGYSDGGGCYYNDIENDFKERINRSFANAYHSGKLAGFEMWEELADKFLKSLFGKKDIHAMAHFTVGYIKSLIEEEKKKL